MSCITAVPEPNLWLEICKEFAKRRAPFGQDDDAASVHTDYSDFSPARHNPVFYGKMHAHVTADQDVTGEFDPSVSHPSCIGYSFTDKPARTVSPPPPQAPNKNTCTPTEYLNHYIFPWLLPALEAMLKQAKLEKCFEEPEEEAPEEPVLLNDTDDSERPEHPDEDHKEEMPESEDASALDRVFRGRARSSVRRRTKFNACDFLTEYLYKHNPNPAVGTTEDRQDVELFEIPFVKEWLKDHPRPPLPMSLIWTDEEAALIIQSYWRGYLVRRQPEVQELRVWQREWREENRGIQYRISEFWDKQMPEGDESQPTETEQVTENDVIENEVTEDEVVVE